MMTAPHVGETSWLAVSAAAFVLLVCAHVLAAQDSAGIDRIRQLRLGGELEQARSMSEQLLASTRGDSSLSIELHLELARIHDRIGLHWNTRPVEAAYRHIELASQLADSADFAALAAIELARAEFQYRAEMAERGFLMATRHAKKAVELFHSLGDAHGKAEAVHRLGLIALQQRDLSKARLQFDRSLRLDQSSGSRMFFVGEYERHIGFVELLENNPDTAIRHFQKSLEARREIGAVDASLFAARTLGSTLLEVGRSDDALPHLLYALLVAERINSPVGKARTWLALGRLYEQTGDMEAAGLAYQNAIATAGSVAYSSVKRQANEAFARLPTD